MFLLHGRSLAATVDAVNEAFFFGRQVPKREGLSAARFIARRHDRPSAYAGTFALFDRERRAGIRAFTGERLIAVGEAAIERAKRLGRNRVEVADGSSGIQIRLPHL